MHERMKVVLLLLQNDDNKDDHGGDCRGHDELLRLQFPPRITNNKNEFFCR